MPPKKKRRGDFSKREWKKKRQAKRNEGEGSKSEADGSSRGAGYKDIVKENEMFVKYYQGLGFIPTGEWDTFMASMREPLPATFRITGTRQTAEHVRSCLQRKFFGQLAEMEVEGEKIPPATPLPWYPNNLAWHVPLTRKFIRKSPLMSKFHSFLVQESEQGSISRQEAVSMIPPLLLGVKPHHKVLDMCAAPGSKTAQLIEALHAEDTDESSIPGGVVIANDADNKRCYMLVHQAKRLNSPSFMVTNHDASVFPMFYYHDEDDMRHPVYYDRVLCDVPCSGDGTLRKNPTIWREWSTSNGQGLHKLQLRILTRGLELLSPGGRLVYSTCSLNPVENEAVIATMLQLCKGAVQLVECGDSLPGLQKIPGLTSWKIMTKKGVWYSTTDELPGSASQMPSTLFPPDPTDPVLTQLPKCIRVLPHHQDTGGFFIALFEKKEWLPWQKQRKLAQGSEDSIGDKIVFEQLEQGALGESSTSQDTNGKTLNTTTESASTSQDTISKEQETMSKTQDIIGRNRGTAEKGQNTIEDGTTKQDQDTTVTCQVTTQEGQDTDQVEEKKEEDEGRPSRSVLGRPSFQQRRSRGFKEDPYVFFSKDSDVQQEIRSYYGMPESFPFDQLLTRSHGDKKKNIYFCSKLVKELTVRNEYVVKIINIGVRLLSRYDHQKTSGIFRLCQEGVDAILPYVTTRTIPVTQEDLVCLLAQPNPLTTALSQQAQDIIAPLAIGPLLFKYSSPKPADTSSSSETFTLTCPMSLSGWRAAKSVRLFVDQKYRYHYLSMLGEEPQQNQSLQCVTAASRVRGEGKREEQGEQGTATDGEPLSIVGDVEETGSQEEATKEGDKDVVEMETEPEAKNET